MLNDDTLKKHPYIGSDLGNELTLNINSRHWGFKVQYTLLSNTTLNKIL